MVAIDGCQVGCAKAILEKNGIENSHYHVITDLGIEKNKNFSLEIEDLDRVKTKIKEIIGYIYRLFKRKTNEGNNL